jgi:hypothetical protein
VTNDFGPLWHRLNSWRQRDFDVNGTRRSPSPDRKLESPRYASDGTFRGDDSQIGPASQVRQRQCNQPHLYTRLTFSREGACSVAKCHARIGRCRQFPRTGLPTAHRNRPIGLCAGLPTPHRNRPQISPRPHRTLGANPRLQSNALRSCHHGDRNGHGIRHAPGTRTSHPSSRRRRRSAPTVAGCVARARLCMSVYIQAACRRG